MSKIFISGSSKIKTLTTEMQQCLDSIIQDENTEVIVGDCYGIDSEVQLYLKNHGYERVTVYTSNQTPRKSVYQNVISMYNQATGLKGEDFYQVKDTEMCNICDSAIAFWNGESYGTKCNIDRVTEMGKPIMVIKNNETMN